jgi:hypothetical protein
LELEEGPSDPTEPVDEDAGHHRLTETEKSYQQGGSAEPKDTGFGRENKCEGTLSTPNIIPVPLDLLSEDKSTNNNHFSPKTIFQPSDLIPCPKDVLEPLDVPAPSATESSKLVFSPTQVTLPPIKSGPSISTTTPFINPGVPPAKPTKTHHAPSHTKFLHPNLEVKVSCEAEGSGRTRVRQNRVTSKPAWSKDYVTK